MSSLDSERDQRPRRLTRSRHGRLIGGVCSGLGAHFDVDPILFRIAFVGLAIFGGVGIWIYLAILLLVPEEGARRAPVSLRRSSWRSTLGVLAAIVAIAVAVPLFSHAALGSAWGVGAGLGSIALVGGLAALIHVRMRANGRQRPSADRRLASWASLWTAIAALVILVVVGGAWLAGTERHVAAWAVVVVGAALVLSAFTRARLLVLPAVAFAIAVAIVAAANVDLHGGLGERTYRPHTVSELRHGYRLGAGRLEVDLRDVAFPAGLTRLHIRLGVGELVVLVPDEVCVATLARIGGGFVGALDREASGLDVDWANRPSPPPRVPRLLLEGHLGLGALFIADRPLVGGFQPGVYGTNEACRAPLGVRQ